MKKKYVYVCFENSSAKYLYNYPSFRLRKGNIVLVETIAGESTAIVVKIKKHFEKNLPYKGKISNVLRIINKQTFKNYKTYKNRARGKVEKQWRHVGGFKKNKIGKHKIGYNYKNQAFVSVFYFKDDSSWIVDFNIKNGGCHTNDGIGKRQLKNNLYQIKTLLKDYTNKLISEEEFLLRCKELSIYYSDV